MKALSVRKKFFLLAVFLFAAILPVVAQEHLKVGNTKTLYFPSSITSKTFVSKPGCWSNWNAAVSVTSPSYTSVTIKANAITNNSAVATVSGSGASAKIYKVGAGFCKITVQTDNGYSAYCNVTVNESTIAINSVSLSKSSTSIEVGKANTCIDISNL